MKKIAIFQKDMDVGGIQRSLLNLFTIMDLSSYEIDLFLFKEPTICTVDELKGINVHILKPLFYFNRLVDIRILNRFVRIPLPDKEYDIAIDYNSYSNECALGVMQCNAKKRIMWVHNDLEIEYRETLKYRLLYRAFKAKYGYFDEYAAVSGGIVEPFRRMTKISSDIPVKVIPNTINTQAIFRKSLEKTDFKVNDDVVNFVFAGRFTHQKGIDILLDEFAKALKFRKDIHLYLLGDGVERKNIENQISSLSIGDYVTLCGSIENPYPYMTQMDCLVLTSRHEGQGMVLMEAKALGLDLIFSRNLEKYNSGLVGSDDIAKSIVLQQKHEKTRDVLDMYNLMIKNSLYDLFDV